MSSNKDPLLTDLKGIILKLRSEDKPITDHHFELQNLCECFEKIFRKGLKNPGSLFGLYKRDYWSWIESLPSYTFNERLNPLFSIALEECRTSQKVRTHQGRGRLFIRIALTKKILSVALEHLVMNPKLTEYWYKPELSIIGNEVYIESLMSLLFLITEIKFDLNVKNASFLDETWMMAVMKQFELVPCKDLGVFIKHINGKAVVAEVEPGSVAEENNKIEVGDVFDELFGENLHGASKGKIPRLIRDHEGWPIYVTVVKCYMKNGRVYPPIYERLLCIKEEMPEFEVPQDRLPGSQHPESLGNGAQPPELASDGSTIYRLKYVGNVNVGEDGGTYIIESAISKVMEVSGTNEDKFKPVSLHLGETKVAIMSPENGDIIFQHSYPEISSCGRRLDAVNYFAYVAGDTSCTISKNFICYVFYANAEAESRTILRNIAQGFGRTTWFV
ncbi:uncharacterized protein LOC117118516 isoform X3 [Anneissia japonica]|uniref:uncharacterized protein LOC117118516 isoform X1 n=1 Tax=Anneissia japonica TaxID=1529436 RepID=UPI001425915A|nr:uncharacterized protein LOC117118516 isoform X1 [Anneissia japonica]XP_033119030.1 uncharacterized protein LOC117118516 isoform X2 [Anneissia japonica]XP_033119031.1 uncharacterized protein LOC117118516 isoform X3 [Anneissia japonica]